MKDKQACKRKKKNKNGRPPCLSVRCILRGFRLETSALQCHWHLTKHNVSGCKAFFPGMGLL